MTVFSFIDTKRAQVNEALELLELDVQDLEEDEDALERTVDKLVGQVLTHVTAAHPNLVKFIDLVFAARDDVNPDVRHMVVSTLVGRPPLSLCGHQ